MNKAQEMLAKAGFPDTAAGRAAFHKQYPTPESFFQVHGGQDTEMYGAGSTIHIDPSKRGTFTAAATKHGKSVQAFASQVLANKENYSPAMVKKANFARNAAKWKHEDGGPVMYAEGGKLPEGILRSRLEAHMSPDEAQNYINKYDAGSAVNTFSGPPDEEEAIMNSRRSSSPTSAPYERFPKKRPNWSPPGYVWWGDRGKSRHTHYANPHRGVKDAIINMHTITGPCESGTCYSEFEDGGVVDAYQLMGMPTPPMYNYGSHITHYTPSYNFGHVQSANNTYRHGFGYGGPIGKYDFGSTIKDIGAGAYGAGAGLLNAASMGATTPLTQAGYNALQEAGGSSEAEKHEQNAIYGAGRLAGAVTSGVLNPASLPSTITEGSAGLGEAIGESNPNSEEAQKWRQGITMAGGIAGMATGMGAFGTPGGSAAGLTKTQNFYNTGLGKFAGNASKVGQGFNAISSGNPMQMMLMFGQPHAMGGAVNAPNMMKYAQGGMTQGRTQINVEGNELLTDENGNILTEYGSNALPPHPADGSMDPRGTVPAQEGQFVITKRLAPSYKSAMKNNDKLYASAMRNNIAFDKQRKEAKQQAMMAKNGGIVGQYGYGGGIMKYDGGSGIPPIDESMAGAFGYSNNYNSLGPIFGTGFYNPEAALNNEYIGLENINDDNFNFSSTMNPAVGSNLNPYGAAVPGDYSTPMDNYIQPSSLLTSQLTPNVSSSYMTRNSEDPMQIMSARNAQMLPVTNSEGQLMPIERAGLTNPMYDNPDRIPFRRDPGETWGMQQPPVYNPNNITSRLLNTTTNLNTGYGENQGKYPNQIPYKVEKGENWGSATKYNNPNDSSWFSRNKQDLGTLGGKAMLYAPALYNIGRGLFEKPFQMNAEDYKVKSKLNPYEEQYRPDYRAYNAALYSTRSNPNLAARTELFNTAQKGFADEKYRVNQANLARKMQADQFNIGLEGQNLNTAMQIAQFNEQNKAAKRNMLGQGFSDLSSGYQFEKGNQMTGNALASMLQHFTLNSDGTLTPKTSTGLKIAGNTGTTNTGTTNSNVFDPSLISPNRYSGGIDFNYTQPSFRNR